NDFRVRRRAERPVALELRAQLEIVVDLAVVGDARAVGRAHRLRAGVQIDDAQTAVREAHAVARRAPHAVAIRSAVLLQLIHDVERLREIRRRLAAKMKHPGYATHESNLTDCSSAQAGRRSWTA